MENLTYIKDSRNGQEAAVINGIARFQMSIVGVLSRSDFRKGEWADYRPIARSVQNKTEFHEHMITVAQHAAGGSGVVDNFISSMRAIFAPGVVLHTSVNGDRSDNGYQLSPEMNEHVPSEGRNANGWYDMVEDGSKVAAFVPGVFNKETVEAAQRHVSEDFPELAVYFEESATPSMGQ
jgi:hypothetical protein